MAEFVDRAKANYQVVAAEVRAVVPTKTQPHCSCCGAIRAVYGKKKERKLCRPCMYLSKEEQESKTFDWIALLAVCQLKLDIAREQITRAEKLEFALDELLRREIEQSRPHIEPTGLRVVAGKEYVLEVTAQRFRRYLTKGR